MDSIRIRYLVCFFFIAFVDLILVCEAINYYVNREKKQVYVPAIAIGMKILVYGFPTLMSLALVVFILDIPRVITKNYKEDTGVITDIYRSDVKIDNSIIYSVGDTSDYELGDTITVEYLPFSRCARIKGSVTNE